MRALVPAAFAIVIGAVFVVALSMIGLGVVSPSDSERAPPATKPERK